MDEGAGRTTVHALELRLADATRGLWRDVEVRTARHPSESAEYFVTRLLAYALCWSPDLRLRDGVCRGHEPVLWEDDPAGTGPRLWIDVGRPDFDRLRHAVSRADEVALFACPSDETVLATWRAKAFQGRRVPRLFLLPRELVLGAAARLERRLEWYLSRDGDELLLALPDATFDGTLVEVHVASGGRGGGRG